MSIDIQEVKNEVRQAVLGMRKDEILAAGLFGSVVRGDFDDKSDIDIFVITGKELSLREQDELYYDLSEAVNKFGRDVTVLTYDLDGLKKVPTWQTLNLLKDGCFVYDKAEIEKVFKKILEEAEKQGIIYDTQEKVFKLSRAERMIFSLSE
jgi:predicted nucleotidyltransferase